jgi:hypothetical protein
MRPPSTTPKATHTITSSTSREARLPQALPIPDVRRKAPGVVPAAQKAGDVASAYHRISRGPMAIATGRARTGAGGQEGGMVLSKRGRQLDLRASTRQPCCALRAWAPHHERAAHQDCPMPRARTASSTTSLVLRRTPRRAAQGVRREAEDHVRSQFERLIKDMDCGTRREVDVLREMDGCGAGRERAPVHTYRGARVPPRRARAPPVAGPI